MPMIINEPGGVVNIFMGRGWGRPQLDNQNNWGRDRDYYQWNDNREYIRPLPYRPDYYQEPYRQEPPRGCSPCEQRQYWHNQRMPQVLRRNPNYR
jgi:hypothetical protein